MTSSARDAAIGFFVLVLGAALLAFTYGESSRRAEKEGYTLLASFNRADGIAVGSQVRLAGVTVGHVVAQDLDERYRAVLTLHVAKDVALPLDSSAMIHTDGLLGEKFIALQPGGDENELAPGQRFRYTQDSLNVSDLLELIIAQGKARRASGPQTDTAEQP